MRLRFPNSSFVFCTGILFAVAVSLFGCSKRDANNSRSKQAPDSIQQTNETAVEDREDGKIDSLAKPIDATQEPSEKTKVDSTILDGSHAFRDEALVGSATAQLRRLSSLLKLEKNSNEAQRCLQFLVSAEFVGSSLRPKNRQRVYSGSGFEVWQAGSPTATNYQAPNGLHQAMLELCEPYITGDKAQDDL